MISSIKDLYTEYYGREPEKIGQLPKSGSNRQYYRLSGEIGATSEGSTSEQECSVIAVYNPDIKENRAFCAIARHFRIKGISVPQVYAVNEEGNTYLQEDLGSLSLYEAVAEGRAKGEYSAKEEELLCRVISCLPKIQFEGAEDFDFGLCYPLHEMDRRSIMFDLNYFKYCFLKSSGVEFDEVRLEDDFERLCEDLSSLPAESFLYRDFQARNVMLVSGQGGGSLSSCEPYFIDFQGGRKGPFYYDVASFVWQARAAYPQSLKDRMTDSYWQALQAYHKINKEDFLKNLRIFVLFRTLQVLGAYGFRGLVEKKKHFIESIPYALANLRTLLTEPFTRYPYLNEVLGELETLTMAGHAELGSTSAAPIHPLTVTITSFSYKKGIPEDRSGNGGGYVFDCRSIHNPGRYEPYRQLTGRDKEVIKFLEDDGEVLTFLTHVYALVDSHVETFISRGFSNLMVSFGCTGGQHRSVYSAEHTAAHLRERFGDAVNIVLIHREHPISSQIKTTEQ